MSIVIPREKTGIAISGFHPALFGLPPDTIIDEELTDTVRHLGLAVKVGVGLRPTASNPSAAIDTWEQVAGSKVDWLKNQGITLIADGDGFCREEDDRVAIDTTSYASQYLQHIAIRCAHGLRLNSTDESNTKLGSWIPTSLEIPWNTAGGPLITYPALGDPSPLESQAGAIYRQWSWWSNYTLRDRLKAIAYCMRDIPDGKPVSCMISAITKAELTDPNGKVHLSYRCIEPHELMAQAWAALGWGASILEFFSFDWQQWIDQRNSPAPNSFLMTGIRPGDAYWDSFILTLKSIRQRLGRMIGFHFKPVVGEHITWFRRGRLVWAINHSNTRRRPGNVWIKPGGVWFHVL